MINGYQSKLLDIYSKIREEENNLLKERKNTIKKYHPEILEIDENIKKYIDEKLEEIINA